MVRLTIVRIAEDQLRLLRDLSRKGLSHSGSASTAHSGGYHRCALTKLGAVSDCLTSGSRRPRVLDLSDRGRSPLGDQRFGGDSFTVYHIEACTDDDDDANQAQGIWEIVENQIPEQGCHR